MNQFKGFIGYTEEEFKNLWESAIFVVDTNILINFYKYTSKESTKSLLNILKKLKDTNRLWIPHQVALEYFFNYENNMLKQHEGYNLLGAELRKIKKDAEKTLSTVKSKHPYIMTDKFQFYIDNMEQSNAQLQEHLEQEIKNLPDSKKTHEDLLNLLDGIIGASYQQDRINRIEKEGQERYKYSVPPGFEDKDAKDKQGYRTYGDIRYQQLYGDLIVWNQMIDRAKDEENTTPIIFVTEEKKADWWEKEGQNIKRPHPQLIQEFINKTDQSFYMYRTDNFVRYAKEYLKADVTDEQVENVKKDVEHIRESEEKIGIEEEITYSPFSNSNRRKLEKLLNNWTNPITPKEHIENELLDKVDINKLLDFLSDEQQKTFKRKIESGFEDNSVYNNAIRWGLMASIPAIEKSFKESVNQLAIKDYAKSLSFRKKFLSLPMEPVKRANMLMEYLEEIETELFILTELPF
ncbi:hypothetical protein COE12_03535 [Bacillus anthracis]|nr:hypothetical protein COE12_03535 [Bacillus anthracis]